MNAAAEAVMKELPDLVLAYGNSDEFRYVKSARGQPFGEIGLLRCAETSQRRGPKPGGKIYANTVIVLSFTRIARYLREEQGTTADPTR